MRTICPMLVLVASMVGCSKGPISDDGGFFFPPPSEPKEPSEPEPEPTVLEAMVEGSSGSFRVLLTLPPSDNSHPLAVVIPGLGPSTAEWALTTGRDLHGHAALNYLGVGTLSFDLPGSAAVEPVGYGDDQGGPFVADPVAHGTTTRSLVLERARAAFAWASEQPGVVASGHYVVTHDFGGVEAVTIADEIGAEAVLWFSPIVQGADGYLHDELHYRDWLRRQAADLDEDMAVTPEEWGYFKGSTGADEGVAFGDLDLNADGLYTREDNELSGAETSPVMQSFLDDGNDVGWRLFWGPRSALFPSTAWAADALARSNVTELLGDGSAPIFVFPSASSDTPVEYLDALSTASGAERIRFVEWSPGDPGVASSHPLLPVWGVPSDYAEWCLRGLVTDPLHPESVDHLNEKNPSPCSG